MTGLRGLENSLLISLFSDRVCRAFGLGDPVDVIPLAAGANVLWRFTTSTGNYVVKELPQQDYDALSRAGRFERSVFESGTVRMPEPLADSRGDLVQRLTGSRELQVCVRAHRFVPGNSIEKPVDELTAEKAGAALSDIQDLGARAVGPAKYLWHGTADSVLKDFSRRWPECDPGTAGWRVLQFAAELVTEAIAGAEPALSHCDHKPENCLLDGDSLIVLDWDEAGHWDPRFEAVESGLRWSWIDRAGPDPDRFASFARGYRRSGREFARLRTKDWTKWIAGLGSWFDFMARSSLGEWPEISAEPHESALAVAEALHGLAATFDQVDEWTAAINRGL